MNNFSSAPSSVQVAIERLIAIEGGYCNNPNDAGGETCWGITVAVARAAGWTGPMATMPQSFARDVYADRYWYKPGFHSVSLLSFATAEELFDTGVNMGVHTAKVFLQRCLNAFNQRGRTYKDIIVDGDIGPGTLDAMKRYLQARPSDGEIVLIRALNALQGARYIELAEGRKENEEFVFGWIKNRVAL